MTSVSGMVLVMTLVALAVMLILLLALFAGASHQIRGAQGDASLAREKILADSAVALVIGQIERASTQTNQAWISQPGLLRTYAATATRTPTACYKLYSTASLGNMLDTSGNLNFFTTDVPANWSSEPSQYTDLNSPRADRKRSNDLSDSRSRRADESECQHRSARREQRHLSSRDHARGVALRASRWHARPREQRHRGQSDRGAHRFLDRRRHVQDQHQHSRRRLALEYAARQLDQ